MDKWEYYDFLFDVKEVGQRLDFIQTGMVKITITTMFFEDRLDKQLEEIKLEGRL